MVLKAVLFILGVFHLWVAVCIGGRKPPNRTESSPFEELYHIQKVFNQLREQMKGTKLTTQQGKDTGAIASRKLEELEDFFDQVKMMTVAPRPTTDQAYAPPSVRNPIKMIFTRVGVGFRYSIAHDTFYDRLDGDALQLRLELLTSDKNSLFPTSWIKLDKSKLEIYGFPLMGNKGKYTYHLQATNSRGKSSYNTFLAYVYANFELFNHDLVICSTMSFSTFARNVDKRIQLVDKIAKYVLGTDLENVWVRNFEKGCISVTFKHLPARGSCNHEAIETIEKNVFFNGKVNPEFIKALKSVTDVKTVNFTLTGACAKKSNAEDSEELEWLKALAPVIILVGIVAIPTCVSCLVCREVRRRQARMRQLQDKKLKEDHETMLVQAQEYKRECGLDEDSDDGCDPQNPKKSVRFSDLQDEDGPLLGKIAEMILPEAFVDTVNKGSELLGMIMPATTSATQDLSGNTVLSDSVSSSRRPSRNPLSHFLDISNPRNEGSLAATLDTTTVTSTKASRGIVDVLRNPLEITTPATERATQRFKEEPYEDLFDSDPVVTTKSGLLSGIKSFFTPAITVTPKSPSTESVAVTTTSSSIGSRIALLLNPWTSFSSEDQQLEPIGTLITDSMEEIDHLENEFNPDSFNQSQESAHDLAYSQSVTSSLADSQSQTTSRCHTPVRSQKGFFTSIRDIFALVNNTNTSEDKETNLEFANMENGVGKSSNHLTPQESLGNSVRCRRNSATLPCLQQMRTLKPLKLAQLRSNTIRQLKKFDMRGSLGQLNRGSRRHRMPEMDRGSRLLSQDQNPRDELLDSRRLSGFLTPGLGRRDYHNFYFNEMADGQRLRRWNSCSPEQFPREEFNGDGNGMGGTLPRHNSGSRRFFESVSARNSLVLENKEDVCGLYSSEIMLPRYDSENGSLHRLHSERNRGLLLTDARVYDHNLELKEPIDTQDAIESNNSKYNYGLSSGYNRPLNSSSRKSSRQSTYSFDDNQPDYHGNSYRKDNSLGNNIHNDGFQERMFHEEDFPENNNLHDSYMEDNFIKDHYEGDCYQRDCYKGDGYHGESHSRHSHHGNRYQEGCYQVDAYQPDDFQEGEFLEDSYQPDEYKQENYHGNSFHGDSYKGDAYPGENYTTNTYDMSEDSRHYQMTSDTPRAPIIVYSNEFHESSVSMGTVGQQNHSCATPEVEFRLREPMKRKSTLRKSVIKQRSFQENSNRLEVPILMRQRRNSLPFEPGNSFDDPHGSETGQGHSLGIPFSLSMENNFNMEDWSDPYGNYPSDLKQLKKKETTSSGSIQIGIKKKKKPSLCWQPLFSDEEAYRLNAQRQMKDNKPGLRNSDDEDGRKTLDNMRKYSLHPVDTVSHSLMSDEPGRRHSVTPAPSSFRSTYSSEISQDRLSPDFAHRRPDLARLRLGSIGRSKSDPYTSYDDFCRHNSPISTPIKYGSDELDHVMPTDSTIPSYNPSHYSFQDIRNSRRFEDSLFTADYEAKRAAYRSQFSLSELEANRSLSSMSNRRDRSSSYQQYESLGRSVRMSPDDLHVMGTGRMHFNTAYDYRGYGSIVDSPLQSTDSPDFLEDRSVHRYDHGVQDNDLLTTSMDTLESVRGYPDGNSGSPEIDNSSPQPEHETSEQQPIVRRFSRATRQSTSGSSTSGSTRSRRTSRGLERQRRVEEDDSGTSSPALSNTGMSIHFNPLADLVSMDSPDRDLDRGYPDGDNSCHGPPVRQYTSSKYSHMDTKADYNFQRLALRRSVYGKSISADERMPEEKELSEMRSLSVDNELPYFSEETAKQRSILDLSGPRPTQRLGRKQRTPPSVFSDKESGEECNKSSSPLSYKCRGRKLSAPSTDSRGSSVVESHYYDAAGEFKIQDSIILREGHSSDERIRSRKNPVVRAEGFVKCITGRKKQAGRQGKRFSKPAIFKTSKVKLNESSEGQFVGSLLNRFSDGGIVSKFQSRLYNQELKSKPEIHLQTLHPLGDNPNDDKEDNYHADSIRNKLSSLTGSR